MENKKSNCQSLFLLFILYIVSFGLYIFVWSYICWKQLKEANFDINFGKKGKKKDMSGKISPMTRTILLLIPVINIIILYELFKTINVFAKINKSESNNYGPVFLLLLFLFLSPTIILGWIPLLLVQSTLNDVWKQIKK